MLRLLLIAALWPGILFAADGIRVGDLLPGATRKSEATFRWFGFPLYDARLYTPRGQKFSWTEDFALEFVYARPVSGNALLESTLVELRRLGTPVDASLKTQLSGCFMPVDRGDRYLAVSEGSNTLSFWRNGQKTCELQRPGIKQEFMAIFLGENTSSPAFTARLRGG